MTDHIPDIVLERYRLQELPPSDAAAIADRLGHDPGLRARLAALDESDGRLRDEVERIARACAAPPIKSRRLKLAPALSLAAAAAAVAIVVVTRTAMFVEPLSVERIKGGEGSGRPELALYRRTADGSERLADGAVARPGDVVRVGYHAAGRAYGAIVSIDGRGTITRHLPADGTRSVALQPDATVLLDQAYELDDAPKWERFYFVAAASPFEIDTIVKAARDAPARLALPHGLDQSTFTLQKESGR